MRGRGSGRRARGALNGHPEGVLLGGPSLVITQSTRWVGGKWTSLSWERADSFWQASRTRQA